ncbi:MAG: hypothetical protein IJY58_01725 [Alphaproteobacteria bacterium]|nr:hypothetical protein [Alphaproteobacteria bacterium]MBQ9089749.1 hypothetical protein [Alphaproteobacteria bacterium]
MLIQYDSEKDVTVISIKPRKDFPLIDSHIRLKGNFVKDGRIDRDILPNDLQISENLTGLRIDDRNGQYIQVTDKNGVIIDRSNERVTVEISDAFNESLVKFRKKTGELSCFINYFYQKNDTVVCTSMCDVLSPSMIYEEADKTTCLDFDERGTFKQGYTQSTDGTVISLNTQEASDLYFHVCLDSVLLQKESDQTRLAPLIGFRNDETTMTPSLSFSKDIDFSSNFYENLRRSKKRYQKKKKQQLMAQIIGYLSCAVVFVGSIAYLETSAKHTEQPQSVNVPMREKEKPHSSEKTKSNNKQTNIQIQLNNANVHN